MNYCVMSAQILFFSRSFTASTQPKCRFFLVGPLRILNGSLGARLGLSGHFLDSMEWMCPASMFRSHAEVPWVELEGGAPTPPGPSNLQTRPYPSRGSRSSKGHGKSCQLARGYVWGCRRTLSRDWVFGYRFSKRGFRKAQVIT